VSSRLQIGPIEWCLDLPTGKSLHYSRSAYDGFWFCGTAVPEFPALVSREVTVQFESRAIPSGTPLYSGGKCWAVWPTDTGLHFCAGHHGRAVARFHCEYERESGRVVLSLDPALEDPNGAICEEPLRYPMDQILSWGALASCGGLVVHAAVVVRDGVGWLLAGRSGRGKSTLSELCVQHGWHILNDDRGMVFKRDGHWRVSGTPWQGSGRFAAAGEVPLVGIAMLEQTPMNQVTPLAADQVRYSLLDVSSIPWFDEEWCEGSLTAAQCLAEEVPFFRFGFTPEVGAVEQLTALQEIGGAA
jgi:hypothetical protein